MGVEIVACPVCKQKLAIQDYLGVGTEVVCANLNCEANLRVTQLKPLRVDLVPIEQTYNVNSRPESYG